MYILTPALHSLSSVCPWAGCSSETLWIGLALIILLFHVRTLSQKLLNSKDMTKKPVIVAVSTGTGELLKLKGIPLSCVPLTEWAPSLFFILMIWMQLVWILKNISKNTDVFSRGKERVFMSFLSEYNKQLLFYYSTFFKNPISLMLFRL